MRMLVWPPCVSANTEGGLSKAIDNALWAVCALLLMSISQLICECVCLRPSDAGGAVQLDTIALCEWGCHTCSMHRIPVCRYSV